MESRLANRPPDRRVLHDLPAALLQDELRRRQALLKVLCRRREQLIARLADLERQIEAAGGEAVALPSERRRPRNELTLTEALAKVLAGRTMSVAEAADAVQHLGYQTTSGNFRTQVNIALIKGKFRRVGRGRYTRD